jgi:hypothetical protein
MSGCDGSQQCIDGDGCFSGANVCLQQSMHGLLKLQVTAQILNRLILPAGESEAEETSDAGVDFC